MAVRAHASYTAGNYDEALSRLSQLSVAALSSSSSPTHSGASGGDDSSSSSTTSRDDGNFRMRHNRALCEYGVMGFSEPGKLEATLRSIQAQLRGKTMGGGGDGDGGEGREEKAMAASAVAVAEQTTASYIGAAVGRKVGAGAGGGVDGGASGAAAASAGLANLDAAEASVLLYNLSALHFQQKQYGAAQAVLEHLFLHIEPLDESLAIHICLLLLDVLCHSARGNLHTEDSCRRFATQTSSVLVFLERPHVLNSSGGGGGGHGGGGGDR